MGQFKKGAINFILSYSMDPKEHIIQYSNQENFNENEKVASSSQNKKRECCESRNSTVVMTRNQQEQK